VPYLLDTNVVSEFRKKKPHGAVVAWLNSVPDETLNVSAVTVGEIQSGIELTRQHDKAKADEIEKWLDGLIATYTILPADAAVFRRWAQITHRRKQHLEDAMIAATAQVRDLTVVTRNVDDFNPFVVTVFNPFTYKS
jgi:toxin FitB